MATRHSITIQIEPGLLGHAAVVVNEPDRQTYAGFGPQVRHAPWSDPKFDIHSVKRGETPPNDFSSAAGSGEYKTFTIPITEAQAQAALKEIENLRTSVGNYNAFDGNVCTSIVNRVMQAAGLDGDLMYLRPSRSDQYFSDVEQALIANPKAKFMIDGAGRPVAIPESLRGLQQDYSAVGSGYDTAAERFGRIPSTQASVDDGQSNADASRPQRYLRGRLVDPAGRTVFETGAPSVPFVRSGPLVPRTSAPNEPPQSSPTPAGTQAGGNNAWPAGGKGTGQALPIYPLPAVLGGADPSAPSGADMDDWFTRWVKPLMQQ